MDTTAIHDSVCVCVRACVSKCLQASLCSHRCQRIQPLSKPLSCYSSAESAELQLLIWIWNWSIDRSIIDYYDQHRAWWRPLLTCGGTRLSRSGGYIGHISAWAHSRRHHLCHLNPPSRLRQLHKKLFFLHLDNNIYYYCYFYYYYY